MAGNGGKRPGAGRKKKLITHLREAARELKRVGAAEILAEINEIQLGRELLESTDQSIRLQTWKMLREQRDGKPAQAIEHTGPGGNEFKVIVEHIGSYTNPAPAQAK